MSNKIQLMESTLKKCPVVPVLVIEDLEDAVPLASALVRGGLTVLEVTLRTRAAAQAISAIAEALPEATVGAGTVLSEEDLRLAVDAGAQFLVSPGATPALLNAADNTDVPLLPGANSPSEVMYLLERGYTLQKFFPAEAAGGIPMLKSIGGPLPQVRFCPTGGISTRNAGEYLALPNVICIGGSWMASAKLVAEKRWDEIEALALEASQLK